MHRQTPLTSTQEMYLKVLYEVRGKYDIARVRDVAKGVGVNPGTVSAALKKLEQAGFVEHEKYGVVALTPAGVAVAECTLRRHDTIRDVLIEIFGVDPTTAADDACLMEHVVSPTTVNRMIATLHARRTGGEAPPNEALEDCSACEAAGHCQAGTTTET
jgi:DtxR family Mn-dependent transcriptional regulator